MKTAVIAWGNTMRQQALKAAGALEPLNCGERELWVFGAGVREARLWNLPYHQVLILEGFGNLYTGAGQYAEEFANLMKEREVELAAFPDNEKGRELAIRVSLGLGTAAVLTVIRMRETGGDIFLERKVYGCNLDGCFRAPRGAFAITFDKNSPKESGERGTPVIRERQVLAGRREELICCGEKELPACESLEHAKRLVVAGRGALGRDTAEVLRRIGKELGAGFGATRPAALEAALPYSGMIGMTGVITRPELCMVFGASGSAPFMIGVKNSRILAAVNNSPDAAIFKFCDLGAVDDAGEFAEAFLELVRRDGRV